MSSDFCIQCDENLSAYCASCGRPTYVGEDFDGPCVHDSDIACALHALASARAEVERLRGLLQLPLALEVRP